MYRLYTLELARGKNRYWYQVRARTHMEAAMLLREKRILRHARIVNYSIVEN